MTTPNGAVPLQTKRTTAEPSESRPTFERRKRNDPLARRRRAEKKKVPAADKTNIDVRIYSIIVDRLKCVREKYQTIVRRPVNTIVRFIKETNHKTDEFVLFFFRYLGILND